MYYVTCDGYPLMDWRSNDLVLVDPKVNLEVNTVGEASFTIYKNHPHYDKLKKLKSVFEVSDETGVIFRGRATRDTVDFDHGKAVDLEGAMAFFNDSIVRPFSFPDDFLEDPAYISAAESGNVIAYCLSVLINNHNAQVQDFQKMKLGNVTVTDPNNYITRSNSSYASTWETLKGKLFDSSLGGYLCIRYEADGNYIDYLAEFTETNSQKIMFGENLLDLSHETEGSATYSAIIPLGAADITIEGQPDGNITDDLVKSGDTIYSKKAVEEFGWIFAPISETTWEDVTDDANLLTKATEWLANDGVLVAKAMEATAVDLHFTNEQVESLRIYKNVDVYSEAHGVTESFPLSKLSIDLLHPQNTKITVGKTIDTLTERTSIQQEETLKQYSKITKTVESVKTEVVDNLSGRFSEIEQTVESIASTVETVEGDMSEVTQTVDGLEARVETNEGNISTLSQTAEGLESRVEDAEGNISSVQQTVDGITMEVSQATGADGQTYASITLRVGEEMYTGQILLEGNVNVSGQLSADALYSALGDIADLTVDRLSTSRRIVKYLANDTSDDNYITAVGEKLSFVSGVYDESEEQAKNPNGLPIYWESDPDADGVTLGTDGYPYLNGVRIYTTTAETDWPVMVYTYTEQTKAKIAFEDVDDIYTPVLTLGAGNANGYNKGRVVKGTDGLEIMFTPSGGGSEIGLKMGNDGFTDVFGMRKTTGLNFSEFDDGVFYERISGDSNRYAYQVEFDSAGNPIKITDNDGNECTITW